MKVAPAAEGPRNRIRRGAAVVVADPLFVVVESPDAADPEAIEDALELLVKWAVRARNHGHPAPTEAATVESCATYGPEN